MIITHKEMECPSCDNGKKLPLFYFEFCEECRRLICVDCLCNGNHSCEELDEKENESIKAIRLSRLSPMQAGV